MRRAASAHQRGAPRAAAPPPRPRRRNPRSERRPSAIPPADRSATPTARRRPPLAPRVRLHLGWPLVAWLVGRAAAVSILIGGSWLLYDAATSPQFQVARLWITGHRLVSPAEVEAAAGLGGQNVFLLRPGEVARRIAALPPVAQATVEVVLPDTVRVHIREREPAVVWQSTEDTFLVDDQGVVLVREPVPPPLPIVRDLRAGTPRPGDRVDADAVKTAVLLSGLLPPEEGRLRRFEYHPDAGVEVPDLGGLRVRFGSSQDLAWKLGVLDAIRTRLTQDGVTASFVDVRFGGRPYYR